jgi:hypothetical protein
MTVKELADEHLKKSTAHHDALAQHHARISKCHKDAASAHSDQTVAQAHRDLSKCHSDLSKAHEMRQGDFENLRERLAEASDATVLDSHESETRDMQNSTTSGFLKRCGVLQD